MPVPPRPALENYPFGPPRAPTLLMAYVPDPHEAFFAELTWGHLVARDGLAADVGEFHWHCEHWLSAEASFVDPAAPMQQVLGVLFGHYNHRAPATMGLATPVALAKIGRAWREAAYPAILPPSCRTGSRRACRGWSG